MQFGITGRSPLLQHHFLTHGLSDASQSKGPIMSRTQIKKLAYPLYFILTLICVDRQTDWQ